MKRTTDELLRAMMERHPGLMPCRESIVEAFNILRTCFEGGGKILICGNGGSAADSEHIAGELMKGFLSKRPIAGADRERLLTAYGSEGARIADRLQEALPAIPLTSSTPLMLAIANDVSPDMVFAQQVYGYGKEGDVLMALSTSGNAVNVIEAVKVAKAFGLRTIALTGKSGGGLYGFCDTTIRVPAEATHEVQEFHLPVHHTLCAMLESELFGG